MNALTADELEEMYKDYLDEVFGTVKIAGYDYPTSQCFKDTDPTAYRCEMANWLDNELGSEAIHEINNQYYLGARKE